MHMPSLRLIAVFVVLGLSVLEAQTRVVMNRYDPAASGGNTTETTLATANVTGATFGKLYGAAPRHRGKVYVPNYDNGVAVYGLLPPVPKP